MPSERYATILKNTMDVDEEYNAEKVHREINVSGAEVSVTYRCAREDVKNMRTAITAFITNMKLVLQTLDQFGN